MSNDELTKILFVLTMMKNKMKDDPKTVDYLDEAIGYIESHLGL